MIMVWERYCNASPKPEFFLFSLFVFSFISQLIWVCLHWNFHRWFSIQKQVNCCTIDPISLKFCTSQHSLIPSTFNWSLYWGSFFLQPKAVHNACPMCTMQSLHVALCTYVHQHLTLWEWGPHNLFLRGNKSLLYHQIGNRMSLFSLQISEVWCV